MTDFLILTFVFLVAGVVAVPLATRLGLGSVLGYLLAGIIIAPLLQALGVDVASLQHFAEFGVVLMLFLVGLELEPERLWRLRSQLLGLGGLQVVATTAVVMAVAMALGQDWRIALTLGLIVSLSSTAIVLQTFNEKGLLRSDGGQAGFAVLLFQDIAVIPMLALIPLLAIPGAGNAAAAIADHAATPSFMDSLEGWQRALVTLAAVAIIVGGGRYLTRPLFRFVSMGRLREMFTATALMLVVGIALLMGFVGLSAALGTFLAGVVLANSEYRHELESDIDPFKGLLLGLFFITVGAGVNFSLLADNLVLIFGLTLALMLVKMLVLGVLAYAFKVRGADKWLFALSLAQTGEFAFVLLTFTVANHVLPQDLASKMSLVVALSMLLTPLLFILFDRVIAPRYSAAQSRDPDTIDIEAPIIIAGHGRVGGIVNRMVRAAGYETVVLDHSSSQLDMLRRFGFKVFFGDATRPDLLHAAGIEQARVLVVAIDGKEQITELVRYVTTHHPHVHVIARATDRNHVYELWAAGSRDIIRETFDSSLRIGRSVLEAFGLSRELAEDHVDAFRENDGRGMIELANLYRNDIPMVDNEPYIKRARELMEEEQRLLRIGPSPREEAAE
ncbi:MAG: cation:proton antiporter [Hyphomicrobiaceae bacterium]|nr:cation:proton antiporter [Hyphomicrobiaceae bacterium]